MPAGTDHDKLTKLKYLRKFPAHGVFEMSGFCLRHLTSWEIKHFLAEM